MTVQAARGVGARPARAVLVCAGACLVAVGLGVAFGSEPVSLVRAATEPDSFDRAAVALRLPRVLLGAGAGAGLSVVGVALQAALRNPLAEPYVLGVSGGAALGATLAIVLGITAATVLGASVLPLFALVGGLAAMALVHGVTRGRGRGGAGHGGAASILLVGVVVNAFASALITFLKSLVSAQQSQALLYWLVGFLDAPRPAALAFVWLYTLLGAGVILRDAPRLNLLALGDETAESLGVDVAALSRRTLLASSLVVGAVVSVTGLIGFVGLVVPHALRRVLGPDARTLVPASFFAGAALLVACDLASRLAFRGLGTVPPVGAVTALLGGPAFLWLLRRERLS
ncbi:MAG TPA: iron ABC transporter permease [Polyangiaceae bacterium]|nr:iron ABC transporter permease [Polyangiaceae bacterium]